MKPIVGLFISFLFSLCSLSQKLPRDGWVELNNGDTLSGKIEEREWNICPTKITFIKTSARTYSINELKSFGLNSGDVYRRYVVSRHLIPYREEAIFPEDDQQIDTITAWLKIIVQAELSLAALYQTERAYFYVIGKDDSIIELIAGTGIKEFNSEKYRMDPRFGKTVEIEDATYKNQLRGLLISRIGNIDPDFLDYSETSLAPLFGKLPNSSQVKKRKSFYFGVSGGVSIFSSTASSTDPGALLYKADFKSSVTPFFKLSFIVQNEKRLSRISFIPSIGMCFFNTTGTNNSPTHKGTFEIKTTYIDADLMTRFILNPGSKPKFFVAAGINSYVRIAGESKFIDYDNSSSTSSSTTELEQHGFLVSPSISTGVLFSKFGVFVNYQILGEQTDYLNSTWKVNRASIGLSYYFKKE